MPQETQKGGVLSLKLPGTDSELEIDIFERAEKKYRLTEAQFNSLIKVVQNHCEPDIYPESNVLSLYYDTPNSRLIRDSLDKPAYKEKLRLRAYGVPDDNSAAFVEIKKKVGSIVYKRRVMMNYRRAVEYLEGDSPPPFACQVIKEIDYIKTFYGGVTPSMIISYHRLAFMGGEDGDLRITFDDEAAARDTDLDLAAGIFGTPLLGDGERILEIKTHLALPPWLSSALDEHRIYPNSFSKYGVAYSDFSNLPFAVIARESKSKSKLQLTAN